MQELANSMDLLIQSANSFGTYAELAKHILEEHGDVKVAAQQTVCAVSAGEPV